MVCCVVLCCVVVVVVVVYFAVWCGGVDAMFLVWCGVLVRCGALRRFMVWWGMNGWDGVGLDRTGSIGFRIGWDWMGSDGLGCDESR